MMRIDTHSGEDGRVGRRTDGSEAHSYLTARRPGIHTQHEAIVFMRTDCHICRSEGLSPRSQVVVRGAGREIFATLYQVSGDLLAPGEAGFSEAAWSRLKITDGAKVTVHHPYVLESLRLLRRRIYGHRFREPEARSIIADIVAGRYSDLHIASFLTACATLPLDDEETIALTRVMVDTGEKISWARKPIVDKHSVGGLPGNRTTPIVVSIVAAHGLTMPKTSSRAITSPAGTADTMETLAPVDLDLAAIRRVVEQEGACIAWGGSVMLSPADDALIRIERALDLDSEGQLVASVLSKKVAAGSSHVVLDIPVGPTAKVRDQAAVDSLSRRLLVVARAFGLTARIIVSDGRAPVGRGIGPALEARDVLAVLQRSAGAPDDLRQRACRLAGALLEMGGRAASGEGEAMAQRTLADGRAWAKFQAICEAQGGMRVPPKSRCQQPILAKTAGRVDTLDNRKLARLAKLAGAPDVKAAGIEMHVKLGSVVERSQPLCTVHAETKGELDYALAFAAANHDIVQIGGPI